MANDRGRQKKLEKQKKKRTLARKQARDAAPVIPSAQASLIRAAVAWPIVAAHLGGHWRDAETPALVGALVTRKMPNGQLFVASALVDRTCLGVKDAYTMRPLSRAEHAQLLEQTAEVYEVLEEVPIEVLRSVVFHAVDYAASLGFAPHEDFPASLFGPRPEPLLDTPWSQPPKPFYLSGPNDDVAAIVAKLEARVGRDGYSFAADGIPGFGPTDGEDEEGAQGDEDDAEEAKAPVAG
jgi:hypothetical protein